MKKGSGFIYNGDHIQVALKADNTESTSGISSFNLVKEDTGTGQYIEHDPSCGVGVKSPSDGSYNIGTFIGIIISGDPPKFSAATDPLPISGCDGVKVVVRFSSRMLGCHKAH